MDRDNLCTLRLSLPWPIAKTSRRHSPHRKFGHRDSRAQG
ncbi:hypothetical protein D049_1263A, partial [Vibrio parahaemolyticus VPTS-2010]